MRVVLTKGAARQLEAILDYIARRSPQGARHVHARIQDVLDLLVQHPLAGPETGYRDGRKIVVSPFPYLIFYRVRADAIIVQRIRHAARRPLTH